MNNLILNLRKALVHYEECVDVDAAEHIMAESISTLSRCCEEVSEECLVILNTMFDDK